MQLRRVLSAAASANLLRRGLSTAAPPPRPPWALIHQIALVKSADPSPQFLQTKPPSGSILFVPDHFIGPLPRIGSDPESKGILRGMLRGTSGDGLLLLEFVDGPATPAAAARLRAARARGAEAESVRLDEIDPDSTRFVCNPVTGEMFRLPDMDGTKKVRAWHPQGILTRSARGHGPPDRYAVAELSADEGGKGSFVMRRFFSGTGEWEKLVDLPSPFPRPRGMHADHEVLAFDGQLCVCPVAAGTTKFPPQSMYRRMGVSEGRMRYVEVSQKEPFVLSSYTLDHDGDGWTLEHQVALSRVFPDAGKQEGTPRIGVIDPLNASSMCVIIGNHLLAIDMDMGNVLDRVRIVEGSGGPGGFISAFIMKLCVLPPWLELSRIPSAGTLSSNNATVKGETFYFKSVTFGQHTSADARLEELRKRCLDGSEKVFLRDDASG
ncbi:unnamed protein product [Urochloa decumbens]|uniref:DUF1618 domain-containing protein n=1 Tax=Urochloa decumbens TaxID=240449 RepID=A0ABC8WGF7_9POAL